MRMLAPYGEILSPRPAPLVPALMGVAPMTRVRACPPGGPGEQAPVAQSAHRSTRAAVGAMFPGVVHGGPSG